MHLSRLLLTSSTTLVLSLAAGCSGDSGPPSDSDSSAAEERVTSESRDCKATVEVSGSERASWKGKAKAEVQKGGTPPAFYLSSTGEDSITVYAEGEDFEKSAVVTVGGTTYTTDQGDEGLEVQANGKGATVDARAFGIEADSAVQVVASFTC